jgi:uncharacterized membrane protein (DUF2068 family)
MRPLGVTLIAILTWLRASLYVLVGLMLIGVGHLSARLVSAVATDSFLGNLLSGLGKALGFGALAIALVYVIVGAGMWLLKNWARMATLVFAILWLLSSLLGVVRYPTLWHIVRVGVNVAILAYLLLPQVKRVFETTALAPTKL